MSFIPHPFPPPPMAPPKTTIKLALESNEKEGPFVRIEVPSNISPQILKTLRDRSLDLWRMNNPDQNLEDAKVFLTYRDSENDRCFIFSEDDLRCALPAYAASLRVFARVECPKQSTTAPAVSTPTPTRYTSVWDRAAVSAPAPTRNTSATQTSQERSFSDLPVHKVVEAVVGVLTTAAIALQKHVRVDPPTLPTQPRATAAVPVVAAPVAAASPVARAVAAPVSAEEEYPFIHGRHTCDGCLTTPILGKRYHAANLPDYDLCAGCKDNYKGDEINFEEAELDRDRPFQERWRRRFAKWEKEQGKKKEQCERKMERMMARHGAHPQPSFVSPVPRRCGGARHWNHSNTGTTCPVPPPVKAAPLPPPEQVDHALKEAIRRSMLDSKPAEKKENKEEKKKEPANNFTAPAEPTPPTFEELMQFNSKQTSEKAVTASAPEEEEFVIPPAAPVGAHPAPKKEERKSPAKETPPAETENSFTGDAEGNGDVAAALGETMDAIANAINDINAELVRHSSDDDNDDDASETSDVIVVDSANDDKEDATVVVEDEEEDEDKEGATILAGDEEEEDKEDDVSQNSWNMVSDDISDEALARAAQVIGSALFESEIKSHGNATNASVPMLDSEHSVPSTLPSLAPETYGSPQAAQTERWALQLAQLHELGFNNDSVTVEIMERLQAANIGSGETDEISVERVVNELMKHW